MSKSAGSRQQAAGRTNRTTLLLRAACCLLPALLVGCESWGKKRCNTCPPPPPPGAPIITPPPAGGGFPPPNGGLPPGGTVLPPAAPPPGAPAAPVPSGPAAPPPSFPAGAGYPPVASFYGPKIKLGVPDSVAAAPNAAPTPANVQNPDPTPAAPTPTAPTPPQKNPSAIIRLLPPEFGSSSSAKTDTAPKTETAPAATPALPVGIPDFAPAIPDRVAAGRKPALDGLDWLKANGYKSALQLRRPGEIDSADRKQFELRGLKSTSLEVSPATLSWRTVDEFAKLVGDPSTQPLFVYDADGALSGGLWYLYFRRVEKLSDEAAKLRATRLGLKEGGEGPQREMWLAVQRLLATGG